MVYPTLDIESLFKPLGIISTDAQVHLYFISLSIAFVTPFLPATEHPLQNPIVQSLSHGYYPFFSWRKGGGGVPSFR